MRTSRGVTAQLAPILSLYSNRDRKRLKWVAFAQIVLSLLDLFGVAMIGVLSALSVMGIQSKAPGKRVESMLRFAHLDNLSFRTQVLILATSAVSAMIIRSLLSVYINKRILFFIALQTSKVSGQLTQRLMQLPLSEIKSTSNQQRLFEVTSGVSIIGVGIVGPLLQAIGDLSLLVILIAGLFSVDVLMTLLAFSIFSSIAFIGYSLTRRKIGKSAIKNTELSISSSEKLVNMIDMYREYYLRNSLKSAVSRFEEERMLLARHSANLNFYPSVPKYFLETSIFILVLALGAFQFSRLDASHAISTLAIFLAAASRIAPASLRIQQSVVGIRNNIEMAWPAVELRRNLDLFESHPKPNYEDRNMSNSQEGNSFDLKAEIDSFTFSNDSQFKLEKIKLVLPEGTSLAIVGPSGSGKSTLVDLILGFLDSQNSVIQFGGQSPINCIKSHPGLISYVPQEIPILNGSIAENIALAPDIHESEVWLALSQAHLDDFVRTLPEGLQTEIGDRGIRLSGGQRQRIGLARALYTKPKLLVLDEATSALDSATEANISESLHQLKGTVSTIVVAHRLSTVRTADKILYLENGRALAEGTFDEVREKVPNFDQQAKLMGL